MTAVEQTVNKQREKVQDEVRKTLIKNAVDCTYYVALGKAMKRDLAEKYGLEEKDVEGIMSKVACDLVDQIRQL